MPGVELDKKLDRMREILRSLRRVAVAFSGGVDSTFLLKVAVEELGRDNVVAVTSDSESIARRELAEARELAERIGAEHVVVRTREFENPRYLANPADRCYYCKAELFAAVRQVAAERGIDAIVCGNNADDLHDWRPGIRAGEERNVRAPCAEAGLSKDEIRVLSRRMGLPTHDKPATPCLASRVELNEPISPEKLQMVEQAEEFLRSLGLREFRVRHHGRLARIELPADRIVEFMQPEVRARIDERLRQIGYTWVAMDLRGFRSGSMNEAIRSRPAAR